MNQILLRLLVLWLMAAPRAGAWDNAGHMLVAQIARDQLTPAARAQVDQLARQLKFQGRAYNGVTIACWADDIKHAPAAEPFRGAYRGWHYINIGCALGDPDQLAAPGAVTRDDGGVVIALERSLAVLRGDADPLIPNRAIALALLTHFVGDIHQPLHCASLYERDANPPRGNLGGNRVQLTNLLATESDNLHHFWDEAYRRHYNVNGKIGRTNAPADWSAPDSRSLKSWTRQLRLIAPPAGEVSLATDFAAWARESNELGCRVGYGQLDLAFGAPPLALPRAYVNEARRLARQRLVIAGDRLAVILNELFADPAR